VPILIVGLGNPGVQFANTRHNVGYMFIDLFAEHVGVRAWQEKFSSFVSAVNHEKFGKLILLKPQTFMNSSGRAVAGCVNFFKLSHNDLLVIHDDLDIQVGIAKLKNAGSHGGHNGLRDIHQSLGTDAYRRIRIGIDRPSDKSMVKDYVLSDFTKAEREEIDLVINKLIQSIDDFLSLSKMT
jgi:PTH1 family peptidyl-tRNA hydrolase